MPKLSSPVVLICLVIVMSCLSFVSGHEHAFDVFSEENQSKPIDGILWLHVVIQGLVWGFMFPIGMVLGLVRFV